MTKPVSRSVSLGQSLAWEIDRRALQVGSSRSAEVVALILLALAVHLLDEPSDRVLGYRLDLREHRHLDDTSRGPGRATLWAAPSVWVRVDEVAKRIAISISESVRVLAHAGLALSDRGPVESGVCFEARALAALASPCTAAEFARVVWPEVADGHLLRGCCRRYLLALVAEGKVEVQSRGWQRPTVWSARGEA